jgi:hypothetical protein
LRIEVVDQVIAARSGEGRNAPVRRIPGMLGVPAFVGTKEIAQTQVNSPHWRRGPNLTD